MKVDQLVKKYQLERHPEGGYFRREFMAEEMVMLSRGERAQISNIYYLLPKGCFSQWHRIQSYEAWSYLEGNADLLIHMIDELGHYLTQLVGRNDPEAKLLYTTVPRIWFSVEVVDNGTSEEQYGFVSCVVAPGFFWDDFELADREVLVQQFPQHRDVIESIKSLA